MKVWRELWLSDWIEGPSSTPFWQDAIYPLRSTGLTQETSRHALGPQSNIEIEGRQLVRFWYLSHMRSHYLNIACTATYSWADPEGGRASGTPPPPKITKYRVSNQYWSRSPEKSQKLQSKHSIVVYHRPTSETPWLACQRNAIEMVFCYRADDGPLLAVLGSSIPSSKKKFSEMDPLRQNFLDPRMLFGAKGLKFGLSVPLLPYFEHMRAHLCVRRPPML